MCIDYRVEGNAWPRVLVRECTSRGLVLGGLLGHREAVGVGVVGDDRADAARVREPLRELQRVGPLLRVRQLHRREVAVRPALLGHLHQCPLREAELAHCAHVYVFIGVPGDSAVCLLNDNLSFTRKILYYNCWEILIQQRKST